MSDLFYTDLPWQITLKALKLDCYLVFIIAQAKNRKAVIPQ